MGGAWHVHGMCIVCAWVCGDVGCGGLVMGKVRRYLVCEMDNFIRLTILNI